MPAETENMLAPPATLADSVNFTLHFTDIQEIDDSLTNDEARQILQLIARKGEAFDSETLDSWIDFFKASQARG